MQTYTIYIYIYILLIPRMEEKITALLKNRALRPKNIFHQRLSYDHSKARAISFFPKSITKTDYISAHDLWYLLSSC